jgi:hypothetical protein
MHDTPKEAHPPPGPLLMTSLGLAMAMTAVSTSKEGIALVGEADPTWGSTARACYGGLRLSKPSDVDIVARRWPLPRLFGRYNFWNRPSARLTKFGLTRRRTTYVNVS